MCQPRRIGFLADLAASQTFSAAGTWLPIGGFTTADSLAGTFLQPGTAFNGTTFTTTRQGYYFLGFNIRVDGLSTGWCHVNIFRNDVRDQNTQGMSTLRGSNNYDYWTFSTSGVVQAPANTEYMVSTITGTDTSFVIHSFSSFTAFEVFPEEGVYATMGTSLPLTGTGYNTMSTWKTDTVQSFLLGGTFNAANGEYTVKEDGIFIITVNVRIQDLASRAGGFVRLLLDVNNKEELHGGMHSIQGKLLVVRNLIDGMAV